MPRRAPCDDYSFVPHVSRRQMLATSIALGGLSLPSFLQLRAATAPLKAKAAKSCIILYCWGGMSHLETWDPKPDAPAEFRGEFSPIGTATSGIQVSEHIPLLARQTGKL